MLIIHTCGPASSRAGPQAQNVKYLSCHQRHRFWLMHAPRSILAYDPLYLNEIVRERGTVSHPTEPSCGHAIDGSLLVMRSPISDGSNNQPGLNVVGHVGDALEASGPIVHFHLITVFNHTLSCVLRAKENKLVSLQSPLLGLIGIVRVQERVSFRSYDAQRIKLGKFGFVGRTLIWPGITGKRFDRLATLHLVVQLAKRRCHEICRVVEQDFTLARRRLEVPPGVGRPRTSPPKFRFGEAWRPKEINIDPLPRRRGPA